MGAQADELAGDYYVPDLHHVTLGITYWASKRVRSGHDYYTAGGDVTGFQNRLAIAGTICPPPHSWGSPRWCLPPAMTADFTRWA
ncbi:hypothetical protein ACNKHU_25735 [Shigella flexneri]